jgi:hypothetical protein
MKKRYVEPLMEDIEMESTGMLCSSDVDGSMGDNAGGAALGREDEWMQWALLGIALDDDD